jgi:hypothetical protein
VAKQVSDWLRDVHIRDRVAQGYTSMEARSLLEHTHAHNWIRATGGVEHGPPFEFGRNGEMFQLFRWTAAYWRGICGAQIPQPEQERAA